MRPLDEVARFLGGSAPVEIVAPGSAKQWDLKVVVPVEDMTAPGEYDEDGDDPQRAQSIWPHVEERVVDLIEAHRSTIVFANSRRLAERLTARLNEIATTRAEERAGAGPTDSTGPTARRARRGRPPRSWRSPAPARAPARSSPRPTTARSPRSSAR